MKMKLVCIKCKKERELTEDEIKEIGAFISNKNLKAASILKYFNVADGETCDGKEHRYGWSDDFRNEISEKAIKLKETENKLNRNKNEMTEIENIINEMKNQLEELDKENKSLVSESEEKATEILKQTGVEWKRWS